MTAAAPLVMVRCHGPGEMWADFSRALGPEAMEDCYGTAALPLDARWGETVWKFHEASGLVAAWASVAEYPKEPGNFELALGVWPRHQGRGHRQSVLALVADEVFTWRPSSMIVMQVFDTAQKHSAQCLRDAERGSAWVYSGRVWYPDALRTFTLTREAWESEVWRA